MQQSWPELPYAAWQDTYATLHMWMQIVGKVALARAAPLNHSWGIAFHLTPRGLRTGLLAVRRPSVHHDVRLSRSSAGDRDVGRCAPYAAARAAIGGGLLSRSDDHAGRDGVARPDMADAGGNSVADSIRAGHRASQLRPEVRRALVERAGSVCTTCSRTAVARSLASAVPSISSGAVSIWPSPAFRDGRRRRGRARRSCATRTRTK